MEDESNYNSFFRFVLCARFTSGNKSTRKLKLPGYVRKYCVQCLVSSELHSIFRLKFIIRKTTVTFYRVIINGRRFVTEGDNLFHWLIRYFQGDCFIIFMA